jgi:hypothetical protein
VCPSADGGQPPLCALPTDGTGTNGGVDREWANPSEHGLVHISTASKPGAAESSEHALPYGSLHDMLSRDPEAKNCHTRDQQGGWVAIDLGVRFIPCGYTLRHARGYVASALSLTPTLKCTIP